MSVAESIEGKNVALAMSNIEKLAEEVGVQLRKLDKKAERHWIHNHGKVTSFRLTPLVVFPSLNMSQILNVLLHPFSMMN